VELPPKTKTERATPETRTLRLDAASPEDISRAAEILRHGGTVAFPTETVYGLGANALSPEAVEKIFIAKQRPHWDPLIVHIASREMLAEIVQWVPHDRANEESVIVGAVIPRPNAATTNALIEKFWPGPLTLLLPRSQQIPDAVTAGRPLVGIRMPAHPVALELIRQSCVPIAAPSANLFGHTSPTTAAHVLAGLDGRIDAVLDAGPTSIGLESTVIGFEDSRRFSNVLIYRPGAITATMLSEVAGVWAIELGAPGLASEASDGTTYRLDGTIKSIPSPGLDLRHYAPRARLILVDGLRDEEIIRSRKSLEMLEESLVHAIDHAYDGHETIGVMLPDTWNPSCAQLIYPWSPWRDGETLARRLYSGLHELDRQGATIIICPVPSVPGIGEAIRDRLQKAARPG
jgi:L-threonylcarbamoyladenylate synthase